MFELFEILAAYAVIWVPSLVAVVGTVATLFSALAKTKEAYAALNKDQILKDTNEKLSKLLKQNDELCKEQRALIDQITKVKNYIDYKE